MMSTLGPKFLDPCKVDAENFSQQINLTPNKHFDVHDPKNEAVVQQITQVSDWVVVHGLSAPSATPDSAHPLHPHSGQSNKLLSPFRP